MPPPVLPAAAPPNPYAFGATAPSAPPGGGGAFAPPQGGIPRPVSAGGFLTLVSAAFTDEQQRLKEERAYKTQSQPVIAGLAGHIRNRWSIARMAKQSIEIRMEQALRQRRGEYDPDKLAEIRRVGGSEVYMMLTSVKCRAASSWIRDVLVTTAGVKPWTLTPTPVPTLTPQVVMSAVQKVTQDIVAAYGQGYVPSDDEIKQQLLARREEVVRAALDEATETVQRMERYIEDQFAEGGWDDALAQFIDDLCTFPAAIIKGPVTRKVPKAKWQQGPQGWNPVIEDTLAPQFERVDGFNFYPMPLAANVNDSDTIERHQLTRGDLQQLKGVDGYDDESIDLVLDLYGRGGLHEWLSHDFSKAAAEGKSDTVSVVNPANELIDALEFWGSVQGKLLLDWGVEKSEVPDPLAEYQVNAWLIGPYVIKAVLNIDPLGRKPYFKASFEEIPGVFWGNGIPDLIRDVQDVCNACARALVNNMGIASGPQVEVSVDRLPPGENITTMFPWKIWQTNETQMGGTPAPAIRFFQPNSNASELMAIFEKFSILADEYSGIPRYMTGDVSVGGLGRTASGLSMMMNNASKSVKQVISTVDAKVLTPLLKVLYDYNMKFGPDDVKGDAQVVARGALSLVTKETAQQRRQEFLQATLNPVDMQIVGLEGRAALLRESVKSMDMNVDKIVPSEEAVKQKAAVAQAQQAQQAQQAAAQQGGGPGGTPPAPGGGTPPMGPGVGLPPMGPGPMSGSGQALMDGTPTTDLNTPQPQ